MICALALIAIGLNVIAYIRENARRDRLQAERTGEKGSGSQADLVGEEAPDFRYTL